MLFEDVIGQQAIKEHIIRTVKEERVSHAYLLTGNEGVGALAIAMAFAQYLNCTSPGEHDSCNTCSSCSKAARIIHPDIHFVYPVIKKGSSTPVSDDFLPEWRKFVLKNPYFGLLQWFSEIGDDKKSGSIYSEESLSIIRKLSLKNFEGKYKVMIIWLPEKMNDAGANKLLKILEEPPLNTVFLLVSENPGTLLSTIVSRTQQIAIPPIETTVLAQALVSRFKLAPDEAASLAGIADRNLVKALENIDASSDKSTFTELFMQLMRATYGRKVFEISAWVDTVAPLSRDRLKNMLEYFINMLRDSYIFGFHQPELVFLNEKEMGFVSKFSPYINNDNVMEMAAEMARAHAHIDQNGNAKIVLFDMAIKIVGMFKK